MAFAASCSLEDVDMQNRYISLLQRGTKYTLNSEPKALTGDKSEGINPLCAKQSFQLWYPGGQRLKVISFS